MYRKQALSVLERRYRFMYCCLAEIKCAEKIVGTRNESVKGNSRATVEFHRQIHSSSSPDATTYISGNIRRGKR